jgi:hypothetical protein
MLLLSVLSSKLPHKQVVLFVVTAAAANAG